MIISGEQDKLNKCLSVVEKGLPAKTTLPILNGILLEAGEGYLRFSSSNLELTIHGEEREINVLETGSIVLPGKLADIVRQLSNSDVKISANNENLRAEIRSGKAVFNLYGMDAAEFPNFTTQEEWGKWSGIEFSAIELREMLKKIIFAISHDEGRPLFRAVMLHFDKDGNLTAIATDTYRLARLQRINKGKNNFEPFVLLVPGRILNEIIKIIDSTKDEIVKCFFKEKEIIFSYGKFTLSSRLLDGKFPEISGVFPAGYKTRITVDKGQFERLLHRAVLLAHGQNQMIMLQINENLLKVRASSDTGNMDEELVLEHKTGDDLEDILLNARFLLDPLRVIEDDNVVMEFNGPLGPCIFYCETEKEGVKEIYQYLVLPIKTEKST